MRRPVLTLPFLLLAIGAVLATPTPRAAAQMPERIRAELRVPDSNEMQIVRTKDGSTLVGRITAVREEEIEFETNAGRLIVRIDAIERLRSVPASSHRRSGSFWPPNPHVTRLFVGPTARSLRRGEGYFADHELFFPSIAIGATDRLTIAGGVSIFPCSDDCAEVLYFMPKLGVVASERTNVAVGALLLRGVGEAFVDETFGIIYGVGTFGAPDASISLGAGYGFAGNDLADRPFLMLGGELRVGRFVSLLTENYVLPDQDVAPVVSYGFRLFGERLSADLGLVNVLSGDAIFPGFPLIGFSFHW